MFVVGIGIFLFVGLFVHNLFSFSSGTDRFCSACSWMRGGAGFVI